MTPPDARVENVGQKAALLLLGAEFHDDRGDHRDAEGKHSGRSGAGHFQIKDVVPGGREASPAVLDWPIRCRPAPFSQLLLPALLLCLGDARQRGACPPFTGRFGPGFIEPSPDFALKLPVFGGKGEVHKRLVHLGRLLTGAKFYHLTAFSLMLARPDGRVWSFADTRNSAHVEWDGFRYASEPEQCLGTVGAELHEPARTCANLRFALEFCQGKTLVDTGLLTIRD